VRGSPLLKSYASKLIQNASEFGSSIYLQSAINLYNDGDYPAAIYAATYAGIFDRPTINNYTPSEYISIEKALISNSTYGLWPNQFAKSAIFYINEYNITRNDSNLENAYSLALLASKLSSANKLINSTFISQPNQTYSYNNISSEIDQDIFSTSDNSNGVVCYTCNSNNAAFAKSLQCTKRTTQRSCKQ